MKVALGHSAANSNNHNKLATVRHRPHLIVCVYVRGQLEYAGAAATAAN